MDRCDLKPAACLSVQDAVAAPTPRRRALVRDQSRAELTYLFDDAAPHDFQQRFTLRTDYIR